MKNKASKDFVKKIEMVCQASTQGLTPKQVIDDLIQLCCNLLTEKNFLPVVFPKVFYRQTDVIRHELSHYKNDLKSWALLAELQMDYMKLIRESEPFSDVLGSLYDEYLGQAMGQYLTPKDVAKLMGMMSMADTKADVFSKPFTISDPAGCGAGSLILSQLQAILNKHGKEAIRRCNVLVIDLDPRMIRMTTAQIMLSAVIHMIPLRMFKGYAKNVISQYDEIHNGKPDSLFIFDMWAVTRVEVLGLG